MLCGLACSVVCVCVWVILLLKSLGLCNPVCLVWTIGRCVPRKMMTVTHIKEGKVRNLSADYGFQETLHYVMYISTCQPLAMQTMQLVVRRLLSRAPLHQEILQLFIMQISFLSRTIDFFFFFLSLWIYLWLAETSQQPISQTSWLKVTPHCNHNHNQ